MRRPSPRRPLGLSGFPHKPAIPLGSGGRCKKSGKMSGPIRITITGLGSAPPSQSVSALCWTAAFFHVPLPELSREGALQCAGTPPPCRWIAQVYVMCCRVFGRARVPTRQRSPEVCRPVLPICGARCQSLLLYKAGTRSYMPCAGLCGMRRQRRRHGLLIIGSAFAGDAVAVFT